MNNHQLWQERYLQVTERIEELEKMLPKDIAGDPGKNRKYRDVARLLEVNELMKNQVEKILREFVQ